MERVLGGGERLEHRVAVEAGWYVRLEIEQAGVDVAASLLGPDGAELFSTDDPDGIQDKEIVAVIAPAAGELVLAVTARDPAAAPGAYRVTVTSRRPAGPGDVERAAAQKAMAEVGDRVRSRGEQDLREAILLCQEAARLWGGAGERTAEIEALNELSGLQLALSDFVTALDSSRLALSLAVEAGDLGGQAWAQNNLAVGTRALGDYTQTLKHYEQALALWKALKDAGEQGRVLYAMGVIHREQGDLDQALRYLSQALPIRRESGDVVGELNTLLALAGVHQGRGEREEASVCLERALELSRTAEGKRIEGSVLQAMAPLQRFSGHLGEAVTSLQQARDIYRRSGDDQMEARSLHNLGSLYLDLGDLDEALRSYEQALELFGGKNPDFEVRLLNGIGWLLYLRGDPAAAIGHFDRALALARRNNISSGIAQALGFKGVAYISLDRSREGLALLQEELVLHRRNRDRSGEAKSLLEIGRARQALGDPDGAAASFSEALALGRQLGNHGLQATCLYRWAVLDRQRGDLRQALSRVEEALGMIESIRSRVASEKLRVTFLASKRSWYELYIDLLLRLEEKEPGRGHAEAALGGSERARARGLLDLIAEGRIDVREGIAPELRQKEEEIGARLSWIQEKLGETLARNPESPLAADLRGQLEQAGEEMERLEAEIQRLHPRYAEVRYPTPLRFEQVQSLLDERTALLEYFVGQESSFLFVVTREGFSAHRLPPARTLEGKVQEVRTTLERPGPLTLGRFRRAAGDLYDTLLEPAAADLANRTNLLISPDGPLSLVPFEALLTDSVRGTSYRDLAYVLRDHAVSYVPSASVLEGLRELRPAPPAGASEPKGLIAFGDPIYPAAEVAAASVRGPVHPWAAPQLPGSGREVAAIARLYPPGEVMVYLRENATEGNVKANPLIQTARRIHFATHGFVDEERPQLSGLMLTRDAASGQDGLLQVFEIFNLRLNADLVTLSACETALGEQVTGEGMVGLTRAFLYAGARSLLVSLWPVSDLSTPDLMTAFYRHLGDSGSKAEALHKAKLERMAAGDEPYRWAPFILAGDPH